MSLSVIQRILSGFSVLLFLLLLIGVSGFMGINKIDDRLNVVTGEVANIAATSNVLKEDLILANSVALRYLLSQSPESLDGFQQSFMRYKTGFIETSDLLSGQLSSLRKMHDVLMGINMEVDTFFDYTNKAFSNHRTMLDMQVLIAQEKLDLKETIFFALEDLAILEEDSSHFEAQFAASYMINQIESLQASIGDYFDLKNLDELDDLRHTMTSTITAMKDKQVYLQDENIDELVADIEMDTLSAQGVIAMFYENVRSGLESEQNAKQLSEKMNTINNKLETLLSETSMMSEKAKLEANEAAALSTLVIGLVLAASMIIAVAVMLWVSRSIRLPLKEVASVLSQISNGDFTQRSDVKTKDEFGELSGWVNSLVEKLQSVMSEIDKASNEVSMSAEMNARLSGESRKLMDAQNISTTDVASSMNEMVVAVDQVAQSSEVILRQVQSVDQRTSHNRTQMESNIIKMETLLLKIEESTEVANQLDEHSKSIDRILDVIQEIAEQTNLLALNAAIEAARAGEQGRGFSVVADEVRTLANRTHDSTGEIQQVIVQLQQGVTKTVESMAESRASANASVDEAQAVGESLIELQVSIAEIRDLSTQIATAAEEQSAVAQDVRKNVISISEMSEQASKGVEESEKGSEGLSLLATHQKRLLSQFRIE